jgi:pimeloyl-ACP methyl ester carboxylesterase
MLRAAGEYSADDFLPSIDVPTLVVAGTADKFTPFRLAEEMARSIPRADLVAVPNATHVAPLEQRELVGRRVLDFLTERIAGAP